MTIKDLRKYFTVTGEIKSNGDILDVYGSARLYKKIDAIPFNFGKVIGDFNCHNKNLMTLHGCPFEVGGVFVCSHNKLTSLVGGPKKAGAYDCSSNNISNLIGGPVEVGIFICVNTKLTSLDGIATSIDSISVNWFKTIELLRLIKISEVTLYSAPSKVQEIIQKYCGQRPLRQAIIKCQRELIDAGYEDNAKM